MKLYEELANLLLAYLLLLPAVAVLVLPLYLFLRHKRRLLPPLRRRFVSWGGLEVLFVYFFVLFWQFIVLQQIVWITGDVKAWSDPLTVALSIVIAFPFQVMTALFLLRAACRTELYQLGVVGFRWKQSVLLGALFWAVGSLLVYAIHFVTVWTHIQMTGISPKEHNLVELVKRDALPLNWILLVSIAVVTGPIIEEFLYRGLIQGWATQAAWRGYLLMGIMIVYGITRNYADPGGFLIFSALAVVGFLLSPLLFAPLFRIRPAPPNVPKVCNPQNENSSPEMMAGDSAIERRLSFSDWLQQRVNRLFDPSQQQAHVNYPRGIWATAGVFACFHDWPGTVSLFFLGLLLGWLAYRTQSLIASTIFHMLFNLVSCISLALAISSLTG